MGGQYYYRPEFGGHIKKNYFPVNFKLSGLNHRKYVGTQEDILLSPNVFSMVESRELKIYGKIIFWWYNITNQFGHWIYLNSLDTISLYLKEKYIIRRNCSNTMT